MREMKANGLLPEDTKVRSSKYLKQLIGRITATSNPRINAMLGLKRYRTSAVTMPGIELMHRIRKGQFDLTKLPLKDTAAPAAWNSVLSAS